MILGLFGIKQIELVIIIPHKESMREGYDIKSVNGFNIFVTSNIP